MKKPFFSKFLENQTKGDALKGGATNKHPSDTDEDIIIIDLPDFPLPPKKVIS